MPRACKKVMQHLNLDADVLRWLRAESVLQRRSMSRLVCELILAEQKRRRIVEGATK